MKCLAIFKDCLREALDAKILYVTVTLSLLISLLVATMTLTPVPAEDAADSLIGWVNMITRNNSKEAGKLGLGDVESFEIDNFKRLNEGTEPWTGEYDLVVTAHLRNGGEAKAKPSPQVIEMCTMMFMPWVQSTKATQLDSTDPQKMRFEVITKGTKGQFRSREKWFHQPGIFFGLLPLPVRFFTLGQIASFIGNEVVGRFGAAVMMLLSCILTAFFIPSMLAKGTVDLLLSKPVNRVTLFIYKFLGGMIFMLLNTSVIMVGIWFGVGVQTGVWINSFLLCIAIFSFQFAIFYAVSVLAGVLTRSPLVSIFAVVLLWGLLTGSGYAYWFAIAQYEGQSNALTLFANNDERTAVESGIEIIHAVLPRYKEIDWLTANIIKKDIILASKDDSPVSVQQRETELKELDRSTGNYTWSASVGISTAFIAVIVGLATWWFATRNY